MTLFSTLDWISNWKSRRFFYRFYVHILQIKPFLNVLYNAQKQLLFIKRTIRLTKSLHRGLGMKRIFSLDIYISLSRSYKNYKLLLFVIGDLTEIATYTQKSKWGLRDGFDSLNLSNGMRIMYKLIIIWENFKHEIKHISSLQKNLGKIKREAWLFWVFHRTFSALKGVCFCLK